MKKTSYTLLFGLLSTMSMTAQANDTTIFNEADTVEMALAEEDMASEDIIIQCDDNNENCEEIVVDECGANPEGPDCIATLDVEEVSSPIEEINEDALIEDTLEDNAQEGVEVTQ